jgi:hypothetical protein
LRVKQIHFLKHYLTFNRFFLQLKDKSGCACALHEKHTEGIHFDLFLILNSILNGNDLLFHAPDTFPPGQETPGTHAVPGWVDPRAGPDFRERQKYLVLAEDGTPARNLVPISTKSSELLCYRVKMFF